MATFCKSEYRYTKESISLAVAKERALAYLREQTLNSTRSCPTSWVAGAIWPGHRMSPQGAGLAASRVLKALERDGKARFTSRRTARGGGWIATT